jgi:hypothetical protein
VCCLAGAPVPGAANSACSNALDFYDASCWTPLREDGALHPNKYDEVRRAGMIGGKDYRRQFGVQGATIFCRGRFQLSYRHQCGAVLGVNRVESNPEKEAGFCQCRSGILPRHWTVVLAAGQSSSPQSDAALARLCETC